MFPYWCIIGTRDKDKATEIEMKTIELDSRPITGTANNNSFYVESESGKYPIGSTLNWTTQKGGGRRGPARTLMNLSKHGKRIGRPPNPPHLKPATVTFSLPAWLAEWLRKQPNQSETVRSAVIKQHGLTPPEDERDVR